MGGREKGKREEGRSHPNLLILTLKNKIRRGVISVSKRERGHESDVHVLHEGVTCEA